MQDFLLHGFLLRHKRLEPKQESDDFAYPASNSVPSPG